MPEWSARLGCRVWDTSGSAGSTTMNAATNSGSVNAAAALTTIPSATRDLADTHRPPCCRDYIADRGDH